MKLDAVLALVKPFLAADAKPDEIKAAILAADKKAKDSEPEDKVAKDRKAARDKAYDKLSAKDKKAFDAMSDEEKEKAYDAMCAKDAEADPEHTNDEDVDAEDNELEQAETGTPSKGGKSQSGALDSAEVDRRIQTAVAARDELHRATREVEPIVGAGRTFDSAGAAYKAGLEALGVDLDGVPESAYRAMLRLAKDRSGPAAPVIATDAASEAAVLKLIPNLNRL